ncbi:thioredoxin domain-containing protein [Candidatus Woesearchaeota archaeon]|nr:thioredoxin domain-containing protein [Candidatus Woesearchaeota archaeon]
MLNLQRNNLDKAASPYLQQHKDNPIYWQEWSKEVLKAAKTQNKPILASVGYATCHWCHVMAKESFSNEAIAEYLNHYYISIKIDREQRPDIDNYCMSFIQTVQGQGGWPLNVIFTPDLKPLFAVTYVPAEPKYGMPGFLSLLQQVKKAYDKHQATMAAFTPLHPHHQSIDDDSMIKIIQESFDKMYGGFGHGMKFPPHNTLLFLLSYYEKTRDNNVKEIIEKTLDSMAVSGLQDHLQGGFFRYCTDQTWSIPHFEKMLYDQAMLLWCYSAAFKLFKKPFYKMVVKKIMMCLEETFENNNLYYAAHDADTDHEEGKTYLWGYDELKQLLNKDEFREFTAVYDISEQSNFEEKNHLIKKQSKFLPDIEQKLLDIRKQRPQPFTDKKIITSWNALLGIALIQAWRCCQDRTAKQKAEKLFKALVNKHYNKEELIHTSLGDSLQPHEFLEDYGALLLLTTYLYEETGNYKQLLKQLYKQLEQFKRQDHWIESITDDFKEIPAHQFDHPYPSSASLAEAALLRTNLLLNKEHTTLEYRSPFEYDFYNLLAFITQGNIPIIHLPYRLDWQQVSYNTLQVKSEQIQYCYERKCFSYNSLDDLKKSLGIF